MSSQKLDFTASMKAMERPLRPPAEKFPKHIVPNNSLGASGLTYSVESEENKRDGGAEFDVLKSILNREGYLNRLYKVVRTVGKKFKPEVADVLDLVRAASLDVVEAVLRWREVKGDHDAAFLWNGVNYLLKMPSDLDYLADFVAIQRWIGFSMQRNPFCVPHPMEEGVHLFTDNPKDSEKGRYTDGFYIGGLTRAKLRNNYVRAPMDDEFGQNEDHGDGARSTTTTQASHRGMDRTATKKRGVATDSPDSKSKTLQTTRRLSPSKKNTEGTFAQTFIVNDDMNKIRQAELVILKEEQKFGIQMHDPDGRIVSRLQALTRIAAVELKKDDKRPLTEPSETSLKYTPHAANSDVGLAQKEWTPVLKKSGNDSGDITDAPLPSDSKRSVPVKMPDTKEAPGKTVLVSETDDGLISRTRGQGKSGGALGAVNTKGAPGRTRRPIKLTLGSEIEFTRNRHIRTLGEKLEEINALREQINIEKQRRALDKESSALYGNSYGHAANTGQQFSITAPLELHGGGRVHDDEMSVGSKLSITSGKSNNSELLAPKIRAAKANQLKPIARSMSGAPLPTVKGLISDETYGGEPPPRTRLKDTTAVIQSAVSLQTPKTVIVLDAMQTIEKQNAEAAKFGELDKQIDSLENEEKLATQQISHYIKGNARVATLKQGERELKGAERSRDIERKRRLLTEEEGRRVGPPPPEPPNVYDFYSIRVQKTIRGFLARCWIRWYKGVCTRASLMLQSVGRGWLGRLRVRRIRHRYNAAVCIQRNFRGWSTRGTSAEMAKQQNFAASAVTVQRMWRGILGRRRAESKRKLDQAAIAAFECVDAKSIIVGDVKELARRMLYAIEEPHSTSYPPDEVLHLIRLCTMVIQASRGNLGFVEYDFFKKRDYDEISGENLTWLQAAKMVNRSERFMRLVRAAAYGPGAKPPRLLALPNNANILYTAQAKNPRWNLSTFQDMGLGSKMCVQLFKWLTSIIEVAQRQQEFLSLIATSFPDWLPKLHDLQKSSRFCEFEIELNTKALDVLDAYKEQNEDDEVLQDILKSEYQLIQRVIHEARDRLRDTTSNILKLKTDQSAREVYAVLAMETKLEQNTELLKEIAAKFSAASKLAQEANDTAAIEQLPELKHELTNQRLLVTELESQKKLLEFQVEANKARRKDPARLTSEIVFAVRLAGECKGAYTIQIVKTQTMLRMAGYKHPEDLPSHLVDIHADLYSTEQEFRRKARLLYVDADNERKSHDQMLGRALAENDKKEQKSKDKVAPSDLEMLEERLEDEREAVRESLKHRQYISDGVLFAQPPRPKPVIIALARDLPGYAKRKISQEITRLMPGQFIALDCFENMGFDFHGMQHILDTGKCILMTVDHGLTRLTRDSFMRNMEINLKALNPTPVVVMAVGDERNKRGVNNLEGVEKEDLICMRDGEIKVNLETLGRIIWEFGQEDMRKLLLVRGAEMLPPSRNFVLVAEAFFIVLSGQDNLFKTPDVLLTGSSWKLTRLLLLRPDELVAKARVIRRGVATIQQRECITQYIKHKDWPIDGSPGRTADRVVHLMAHFVEQWALCERRTQLGGGQPLQSFTRNSMSGFEAVVVVSDGLDQEDTTVDLVRSVAQASAASSARALNCGWRTASSKLILAALRDLRVCKTTKKINGVLHNISVYRENEIIYLEAYNPATSQLYLTTVSLDDCPRLLVPNAFGMGLTVREPIKPTPAMVKAELITAEEAENTGLAVLNKGTPGEEALPEAGTNTNTAGPAPKIEELFKAGTEKVTVNTADLDPAVRPPQTPAELYQRMIGLLKLENPSTTKDPAVKLQLQCKRDYTFLKNVSISLNNHLVMLKCYEAAMGELYFAAYLPEYSAHINLLVNDAARLALMTNRRDLDNPANELEKDELEIHKLEDARPLLPYILDRLRLSPSKAMLAAKGLEMNTGVDRGQRLPDSVLRRQGFTLRAKLTGSGGRLLGRRVKQFHSIPHIVEIRSKTVSRNLEVTLYEPRTQHSMQLIIPFFIRRTLLGKVNDDMRSEWASNLLKRLKVNWRGDHSLYFDQCVYSAVKRVTDKLFIVKFHAINEAELKLTMLESSTAEMHSVILDKEQLVKLLHYQSHFDDVNNNLLSKNRHGGKAGRGGNNKQIKKILETTGNNFEHPDVSITPDTHPDLFSVTIESIFNNRDNMNTICHRITQDLTPRTNSRIIAGPQSFELHQPIHLQLQYVSLVEESIPEKGTSVSDASSVEVGGDAVSVIPEEPVVIVPSRLKPKIPRSTPINSCLKYEPRLKQGPRGGTLADVIRCRRQMVIVDMEAELNALAQAKEEEAAVKARADAEAGKAIAAHLTDLLAEITNPRPRAIVARGEGEGDAAANGEMLTLTDGDRQQGGKDQDEAAAVVSQPQSKQQTPRVPSHPVSRPASAGGIKSRPESAGVRTDDGEDGDDEALEARRAAATEEVDQLVRNVTSATVSDGLLGPIHKKLVERFAERNEPGQRQVKFLEEEIERVKEETAAAERAAANYKPVDEDDRGIPGTEYRLAFEGGVKTHYKEGTVRWHGHVSIKVYQQMFWIGGQQDNGEGRRLKFVVFEPISSQYFEGHIRSRKHLREVLGVNSQDLLEKAKLKEMIMFVIKNKLDVTVNKISFDGEPVPEGSPPYRIEFRSDRLFNIDKVTPINANADADEEANSEKLIDMNNARGKKLVRVVRRVSGLLMNITVFEIPQSVVDAAQEAKAKAEVKLGEAGAITITAVGKADNADDNVASGSEQPPSSTSEVVSEKEKDKDKDSTTNKLSSTEGPTTAALSPTQPATAGNETSPVAAVSSSNSSTVVDSVPPADGMVSVIGEGAGMPITSPATGEDEEEYDEHGLVVKKVVPVVENEVDGFAEKRPSDTLKNVTRWPVPAFRIVAYDPRSRRKVPLGVEPQAVLEVCGGEFSPYLDPEKRLDLAKIICDTLVLVFPSGRPFEVIVPWSGAKKEISTATVSKDETKMSTRASADRVVQRKGKLFRSVLRITKNELLVSVYAHTLSNVSDDPNGRALLFNFYSPAVSQSTEILVSEPEQVERIGRPVLHFSEGSMRSTAVRYVTIFLVFFFLLLFLLFVIAFVSQHIH